MAVPRNKSVDVHQFAMVPRAEIPRSSFRIEKAHKTTVNAGSLIPIYLDEVLPGDTFNLSMTIFARMATPIFPIMDNLHLDSFWFFVPNRLVWSHWQQFMGEQANPADTIAYTIPQCACPAGGYVSGSLFDYMGLPTAGQILGGQTYGHSALFLRAYNLIYNKWFRDENLQNSVPDNQGDGPDTYTDYVLKSRGKRHDYFTSALPWTQKGGVAVTLPLGTSANILTAAAPLLGAGQPNPVMFAKIASAPALTANRGLGFVGTGSAEPLVSSATTPTISGTTSGVYPVNLYADLSTATSATINQLRQSFQIQKLLERDARGGTRYTEIVRSHFGVISPDARLQRPEYLGGGSTPVQISSVPQTSATGLTGGTSPIGTLSAFGTAIGHNHGFTQSFTEHGMIVGLIAIRADLTYQQGIRKMWLRNTRYDFYFPVFATLGEQSILNREIYADGTGADGNTFGYQERWAEYRFNPSQITGMFRSTVAGTLDGWHLAQKFTAVPVLNDSFITDAPPIVRVVAAGAAADKQQFLVDSFFSVKAARPLPLYSVPGLIDHF